MAGWNGEGPPYYYDYANRVESSIMPSTVHIHNTASASFFRKYLIQRAMAPFKFTLPETWAHNYFMYVLFTWGYIGVFDTDKFGVICQGCGLKGYNVFYQPMEISVSNPLLSHSRNYTIDKDCVVIQMNPDYSGIMDIVSYYADLLALCAEGVSMNILNSKLSYVFTTSNRTAAESMKKLYDKVASGEPAVVADKSLTNPDGSPAWNPFTQNVGQNYIADRILADMQTINNQFDTEIGIPNANTQKRERLISSETNANNIETYSKAAQWMESFKKSCEKARNMFNIDLGVEWRFPNEMGGDSGNEGIPVISEPVSLRPKVV